MDYKYTGIILNKRNVGETDRIYTIYTQEAGKIRVLGKSVRKPNAKLAGSLEPVTLSEIFVAKTRGMGKLTGVIAAENFSNIKGSVEALERVDNIFKIFGKKIAEQERDGEIFAVLLGFLRSMDNLDVDNNVGKMDVLVLGFLFKLLDGMGYHLEMDKCVGCGSRLKPDSNFFSPGKGGVLCGKCQGMESKKIRISSEAIKLVRIFSKNRIENLVKLKVPQKDINNLKIIAQEAINWL